MQLHTDLIRHGLEFSRAIEAHQYEMTDVGIHFPKQKVIVASTYTTRVNGAGQQVDPNIMPTEALNYLLKLGLTNVGGLGNWYVAPFVNNVAPLATLTAANFAATQGEFTTYDEVARPALTVPADPVAGSYSNEAAPAVFTAGAVGGGGVYIYGAAVLSASAKSATTGKLLSCSLFGAARQLFATDKLTVEVDINATST